MAEIEIGEEREQTGGWAYDVTVFEDGRAHHHQVTLSYQDYDHWSHGQVPPSKVVQRAFEFLLEKEPASSILPKFDCSVMRRYFPDVDRELQSRLGPEPRL